MAQHDQFPNYLREQARIRDAYRILFAEHASAGSPAALVLKDLESRFYCLHDLRSTDPYLAARAIGAYSVTKMIRSAALLETNTPEEI